MELLPYIPKNSSIEIKYSEWSGRYWHKRGIERACVELVKNVLRVHGEKCEKEQLFWLENMIYKYISPKAVEWYQRRIEWNKLKQSKRVYWSFWGDLQYELLLYLPEERISKKSKDLMQVLGRRFDKVQSRYYNKEGHSGWVKSPVSGKNIGKKQWFQIITNSKLEDRNRFRSIEVKGGFIESSYEMYVDDFQLAVKQDPQGMIDLVLEHKDKVLSAFIDSLFLGVNMSENLIVVEPNTIEKMFQ